MRRRVYVETTIISYLTARPSRDLVRAAQQELTREWWENRRQRFDLFVSQFVLDEASLGDQDAAKRRLETLAGVTLLDTLTEVTELADSLIRGGAIPRGLEADALHVAIAAMQGMDILLTWNCRHLANPQRLPDIVNVLRTSGYAVPVICTPFEIMGENYAEGLVL